MTDAEKSPDKAPDDRQEKYPNLKPPWKKGQSGNPKGRPKGSRTFAFELKQLLEKQADAASKELAIKMGLDRAKVESANLRTIVSQMLVLRCMEAKDPTFMRILMERTDGRTMSQRLSTLNQEDLQGLSEKEQALSFYRSILDNEEAGVLEKLKAREDMNKVLGLIPSEKDVGDADQLARDIQEQLEEMDDATHKKVDASKAPRSAE